MFVILNKRTMLNDPRAKECDEFVYVGRPSVLGNPYVIGKDGNREEVIMKYRAWIWKKIKEGDPAIIQELKRIGKLSMEGKTVGLVCWCYPLPCHAEVVYKAAEWIAQQ